MDCFCAQSTSNAKGTGFPEQPIFQFSWNTNWVFCSVIHFDTDYTDLIHIPSQVKGPAPQDCLSLQVPIWSSLQVTHTLVQLSYKAGGPTTPCSGSVICSHYSQNPEKHFIYYYWLFIKETNKQPDEQVHRAGSRRVPSAESFVPWSLGWAYSLRMDAFSNLGVLWTLLCQVLRTKSKQCNNTCSYHPITQEIIRVSELLC